MSKLTFGMPTLIELDGIKANVELCAALGLSFVELNMNQPEFTIEALDLELLKSLAKQHGIGYTLHLPEALDVACFDLGVREAWLKTVAGALELAKQLEIPVVNMHMHEGIHFKLPSEEIYLYEKYSAAYQAAMADFANKVQLCLDGTDIKLAVENTGIFNRPHIIGAVEGLLKYNFVTLTWDIGHDHVAEGRDTALLHEHRHRVGHMHVHDALGSKNHMTLYTGELDLDARLSFASERNCRCVVETKSVEALGTSVAELKVRQWLR